MKKFLLAALAVTAVLATAGNGNANPGNISWTVHNMSKSAPWANASLRHWYSSEVDQVCVFCHTPHNAKPSVPLWNKVNPTQTFRMYTSSPTLSPTAKAVTAPGPESLLCLSCHDGRTAINVLHNSTVGVDSGDGSGDKRVKIAGFPLTDPSNPNAQALAMGSLPTFGTPYRANLGKTDSDTYAGYNLMDDHPISFSYTASYGQKGAQYLNDINTVKAQGFRFYGPNRDRMECSTCHDPHADYGLDFDGNPTGSPTGNTKLRPFLVRDNVGSAMCFTCHNK
ncbi:cytochrome c3 family protein [Geobacter pickeringii]|uniref:Cytochrome C n=1 Tax=Geobacter pickeringii TaxID=345632 RepID=A0A0B5B7D9_9BACT|nr:cytochrome c3 family protein [Geobacter pickeringii]AJE02472.1 cytochrome C [Geobacter pickeringii]